jgi:acetylornithine/succinyldiaminopimelate/putrescine aminotransferase
VVIRLLPPFIITESDALEALGRFESALAAVGAQA